MNRITPNNIQELKENEVFVFGSNGQGLHYGGAAKLAFGIYGAVMGQSEGLQGRSYGINSMDGLDIFQTQVERFAEFASENKQLTFFVTEIGCGIAGYTPEQIAPLFKCCKCLSNVCLPERFWNVLEKM